MTVHADPERAMKRAADQSKDHPTSSSAAPAVAVPAAPLPISGRATTAGPAPVRRAARALTDPLGGTDAAPDVVAALRRRRGGGSRLPSEVESSFGAALGTDLSEVRVHADSEADSIARSVQATAFTHGSDIYFTSGTFSPSTSAGQHLLAHELSHVVQQRSGADAGQRGVTIGRADDPMEADAERRADRAMGALRRRAAQGEQPTATTGRLSRVAAGLGAQIRRVLTDSAAIALAAKKIANGHAFKKHVKGEGTNAKKEFEDMKITTETQFESHISQVMQHPSESKDLSNGRSAYWDNASGTIVLHNPGAADDGTCFRPTAGKAYYDKQV
jgi:hypothetical protein